MHFLQLFDTMYVMKNEWIALVIIILVIMFGGLGIFYLRPLNFSPASVKQQENIAGTFCTPSDLDTQISTEGAAGSIYGNITIKNISGKPCQITGNNYIEPVYTAKNITVSQDKQKGQPLYTLLPHQSLYSRVRYPNGPQCSRIKNSTVSFSYKISPVYSVTFKNTDGNTDEQILVCTPEQEVTDIHVWSLSDSML